jgi:hypothetical protein
MDAITNPDALAILAYLLDKSENWQPRAEDIKERWGFGRPRYRAAIKELADLGIITYSYQRDEGGKVNGRTMQVRANLPPTGQEPAPSVESTGESASEPLTDATGLPTVGDPVPITTRHTLTPPKGSESEAEAKPTAHTRSKLPEDWYPSKKLIERIQTLGLVDKHIEQDIDEFIDYWTNGPRSHTARTARGWDQALINQLKAQQKRRGTRNDRPKTSTDLFADDLDKALSIPGPGSF